MTGTEKTGMLVLGYGNPGRGDDALGPELARGIEMLGLPGVASDADYQLNLEHGAALAECGVAVLVDASRDAPEPFSFRRLAPAAEIAFSSHAISPEGVLAVAEEHFGGAPETWLLGVRGYEFDFVEGMSPCAQRNLHAALEFLQGWIQARCAADA
jgi:hydrogenase maturation protease